MDLGEHICIDFFLAYDTRYTDIMALAWSNDGYYLATGGSDRMVIVWDTQNYCQLQLA